jgi:hypothetical protein
MKILFVGPLPKQDLLALIHESGHQTEVASNAFRAQAILDTCGGFDFVVITAQPTETGIERLVGTIMPRFPGIIVCFITPDGSDDELPEPLQRLQPLMPF